MILFKKPSLLLLQNFSIVFLLSSYCCRKKVFLLKIGALVIPNHKFLKKSYNRQVLLLLSPLFFQSVSFVSYVCFCALKVLKFFRTRILCYGVSCLCLIFQYQVGFGFGGNSFSSSHQTHTSTILLKLTLTYIIILSNNRKKI